MGLANPNARILIIDDEENSAQTLLKILEQAGYGSCTVITDSSHAAKQILDLNPDLVLLDLLMEPISGLKVMMPWQRVRPIFYRSLLIPLRCYFGSKTFSLRAN